MKVALLDIQTRQTAINKTIAGGFGTSSRYSDSKDIRIVLLQKFKKKGVFVPLIELAYHAAIFKSKNYEVEVVYGNTIPEADVYIIYGSLVEHYAEIAAAGKIRKKFGDARIGFIGLLPTVFPDLFLQYSDFVVTHESEKFFLNSKKPLESLRGEINAGMMQDDLNDLPFPDWSFFDMKRFIHYPFFGRKSVFPALTSRGCPYPCGYYCPYPIRGGKTVRYRSLENVLEELKYLKQKHAAEAIFFRDPIFTFNRQRTETLCRKIIDHNLDFAWACETHPARLDKPLIDLMYAAGARAIIIGVESKTPEVIKQIKRKGADEKHLTEIVSYAEGKGIALLAGYIFGNPTDTKKTITDTIAYAIDLNTTYAQFVISTPYPGTPYYKSIENELTTRDWTQFDTYTLVFKHPNLTHHELEALKTRAYLKYYFRPGWIFNKFLKKKFINFFNLN